MRTFWTPLMAAAMLGCGPEVATGQFLHVGPDITYVGTTSVGVLYVVNDGPAGSIKFQYARTLNAFGTPAPGVLVVSPSSGTTPATVYVGVNPSGLAQMTPGLTYSFAATFTGVGVDQNPPASAIIRISVPAEPPPAIQSVVNAASLQPSISPGATVSILGSHLTGPTQSTTYDDAALYPTSVAGTSVTFNGVDAPLLYVSPGQINGIVPYSLAGQTSAQVVVQRINMVSAAFTLPLQDTAPAIFTAAQTGAGQGAILQQGGDGQFTFNSSNNPAPRGAMLEIFANGAGVWTPAAQTDIFVVGQFFKTQPVSVTIGGQSASVLYAGTARGPVSWSVLQVNAAVPQGTGSGPQPVVLKIGANDNSQQRVTVWVQ
jgi:uncharacterized protein (TIGR03437 family)